MNTVPTYCLLFSLIFTPVQALAVWSAEEGVAAFGDLVELSHGDDFLYDGEEALQVLADIYSEMNVRDFNQVVTFLLGVYQQEPSSRSIIYRLMDVTSNRLVEELNEQESDNLLWSSANWAMNGAFLLALTNMSIRLSRVGVFKRGVDKLKGIAKGKSDSRSLIPKEKKFRFKSPFEGLKKWNKTYLNRAWRRYAAAAAGGGILGVGIFYGNKLNRRIHPRQSLLAINYLFLGEALVFAISMDAHPSSKGDDIETHLRALDFLMETESRFKSGVEAVSIREGLEMLEKMNIVEVPDYLEEEILKDGVIHLEAVRYQLSREKTIALD